MRYNLNDWPDEVDEGRSAYKAMKELRDNPYSFLDVRCDAWEYGWKQEQEDSND